MASSEHLTTFKIVGMVCAVLATQSAIVWTVAAFYYSETPRLAVFDPERSVERFVRWSANNVDDAKFDDVLTQFGSDIEAELSVLSTQMGMAVVRSGAVLSSGGVDLIDWTDAVVARVLP